jgi:hypothetical protein
LICGWHLPAILGHAGVVEACEEWTTLLYP